jgi:hypothetical protein
VVGFVGLTGPGAGAGAGPLSHARIPEWSELHAKMKLPSTAVSDVRSVNSVFSITSTFFAAEEVSLALENENKEIDNITTADIAKIDLDLFFMIVIVNNYTP